MKTLRDYMGDATRGGGRKFRVHFISEWFEPIFKGKYNVWVGLDSRGEMMNWHQDVPCEPYVEPKKTETRWLWASKDGFISNELSSTPVYETRRDYEVKLEWSATQFESGE